MRLLRNDLASWNSDVYWVAVGQAEGRTMDFYVRGGKGLAGIPQSRFDKFATYVKNWPNSLVWQVRRQWDRKGKDSCHYYYRSKGRGLRDYERISYAEFPDEWKELLPDDSVTVIFFALDTFAGRDDVVAAAVICFKERRRREIGDALPSVRSKFATIARQHHGSLRAWTLTEVPKKEDSLRNLLWKFGLNHFRESSPGVVFGPNETEGNPHSIHSWDNLQSRFRNPATKMQFESLAEHVHEIAERLSVKDEVAFDGFLKPLFATEELSKLVKPASFEMIYRPAWTRIVTTARGLSASAFSKMLGLEVDFEHRSADPLEIFSPVDPPFRFFGGLADAVDALVPPDRRYRIRARLVSDKLMAVVPHEQNRTIRYPEMRAGAGARRNGSRCYWSFRLELLASDWELFTWAVAYRCRVFALGKESDEADSRARRLDDLAVCREPRFQVGELAPDNAALLRNVSAVVDAFWKPLARREDAGRPDFVWFHETVNSDPSNPRNRGLAICWLATTKGAQ